MGLLLITNSVPVAANDALLLQKKKETFVLKVAKGGYWEYQVKFSTPTALGNTVTALPFKKDGMLHYFYDEKRVYQGEGRIAGLTKMVGSLEIFMEGHSKSCRVQYVGIKPDGYWSYGALVKHPDGQSSRIILKDPMPLLLTKAKPGTAWTWKAKELVYEFRVIGIEEVIVPAGLYQALKIQMVHSKKGIPQKLRHYWFVNGVGIVKELEEQYLTKAQILTKSWELKKVNLQGPDS